MDTAARGTVDHLVARLAPVALRTLTPDARGVFAERMAYVQRRALSQGVAPIRIGHPRGARNGARRKSASGALPLRAVPRAHGGTPLRTYWRTPHALGATLARPLMMRSIASPPWGSVRLASILRTNFIRIGWVRPRWVASCITFGLPISFTKPRPSV
ncbi:hypothetical protein FB465_4177 [Kitasatospora atroaurantiaca]|uniref:Uncharacterized protein n=1 Tax=Kitasatospora atroaurantiaca TaxID=285545 RepID=A0A561ETZ2_9ACTN|nr:hypothetical protein FB465_4177 [Kitasatospora atroaurantiaca]